MELRAIVFEDEDCVRNLLSKMLRRRGYDVLALPSPRGFCSPHSGTCRCGDAETCADILISDVQMPGETGLEVVRRLAQKGCRIRHMAMLSGYWTDGNALVAEAMGCTVFHKPVSLGTLQGWLDDCERDIAQARARVLIPT